MNENRLIDKKELINKHPALGVRPHRIDWLIRTKQIPYVKIGRRVYFEERTIELWIVEKGISVLKTNE